MTSVRASVSALSAASSRAVGQTGESGMRGWSPEGLGVRGVDGGEGNPAPWVPPSGLPAGSPWGSPRMAEKYGAS